MPQRATMLVAVHLFLLRDNEVLLLRRANTGYEDGNYSVPAGHVDGGEPIASAMIREAAEEIGITISPADIAIVQAMHRRAADERIDFFLTATRWSGQITNNEPDKCDDLSWHNLDALPPNVIPYVRAALTNYHHGLPFTSFGWDS